MFYIPYNFNIIPNVIKKLHVRCTKIIVCWTYLFLKLMLIGRCTCLFSTSCWLSCLAAKWYLNYRIISKEHNLPHHLRPHVNSAVNPNPALQSPSQNPPPCCVQPPAHCGSHSEIYNTIVFQRYKLILNRYHFCSRPTFYIS